MLSYIQSSYLRGYSKKLGCYSSQVIRNALVSKLVMDRDSPRVLRAPDGYGKSTLCFQYAEIMFGLEHVFWFDCEDARFIRDLDNNSILHGIFKLDKSTSLVIFDNLIYLNLSRSEKFFSLVKELTDKKIEVLITYTPINSPENAIPKEYVIFGSEDMLITPDEFNGNNKESFKASKVLDNCNGGNQYPAIGFKRGNRAPDIIKNNLTINLPVGLRFSIFVILVCQRGTIRDVQSLLGKSNVNLLISYAHDYLHLGIDKDKFWSIPVAINDLLNIFESDINIFTSEFVDDENDLFEELIDICIQNNNISRAYEISKDCCCDEFKLSLLDQFYSSSLSSFDIVESCCLMINLLENNDINMNESNFIEKLCMSNLSNIELLSLFAYNLLILGDKNNATKVAYSLLQNTKRKDIGLFCALLFYICGNKSDMSNAQKIIDCFINLEYAPENNSGMLAVVSDTLCQIIINEKNKTKLSEILLKINECNIEFLSTLSCGLLLYMSKNNLSLLYIDEIKCLISDCVNRVIKNNIQTKSCADYFFLKNYCSLASSHIGLRNTDDEVFCEAKSLLNYYEEIVRCGDSKIQKFKMHVSSTELRDSQTLIDVSEPNKQCSSFDGDTERLFSGGEIPILKVNLFSGFRLMIGDRQVPPEAFSRKKIKTLLTFLILESGRNISGVWLSKSVWPDQNEEGAMSNLNSLWVSTRKVLKDEEGNCPYLQRFHNEFAVNSKYVVSDINDIDFLYERYTLSNPDPQLWVDLAREKMNVLKGELLPGETSNHYIVRKREMYKNKILEALLCASERLSEIEYFRESLWFARLALDVDSTREDVYYAMMKTQYLAGKRSNAIQTYLACKKLIEEESQYPLSRKTKILMEEIVSEKA